jgi:hypothetical protein
MTEKCKICGGELKPVRVFSDLVEKNPVKRSLHPGTRGLSCLSCLSIWSNSRRMILLHKGDGVTKEQWEKWNGKK